MLRKQLITLAAILGILGCGACFLPPLIPRTPPPPPMHIDLRGVRTIGVTAANESEMHRLDAVQMAKSLAEDANDSVQETRVRLRAHRDGRDEDAQLKLVILKETAIRLPQRKPGAVQTWALRLNMAMTLTARNGRVIWQDANWQMDAGTGILAADEAAFLQRVSLQWVYDELGYLVARHMFYGERQ